MRPFGDVSFLQSGEQRGTYTTDEVPCHSGFYVDRACTSPQNASPQNGKHKNVKVSLNGDVASSDFTRDPSPA